MARREPVESVRCAVWQRRSQNARRQPRVGDRATLKFTTCRRSFRWCRWPSCEWHRLLGCLQPALDCAHAHKGRRWEVSTGLSLCASDKARWVPPRRARAHFGPGRPPPGRPGVDARTKCARAVVLLAVPTTRDVRTGHQATPPAPAHSVNQTRARQPNRAGTRLAIPVEAVQELDGGVNKKKKIPAHGLARRGAGHEHGGAGS